MARPWGGAIPVRPDDVSRVLHTRPASLGPLPAPPRSCQPTRMPPCAHRYGFQPQRVAVWIYWHAVLLLAKGVPFFRWVVRGLLARGGQPVERRPAYLPACRRSPACAKMARDARLSSSLRDASPAPTCPSLQPTHPRVQSGGSCGGEAPRHRRRPQLCVAGGAEVAVDLVVKRAAWCLICTYD